MLKKYLDKLTLNQLYIFTTGAFSLFLLDCVIPDPIPLIDEAALLYTTLQGLRTIAMRRKSLVAPETSTQGHVVEQL